MYQDLDKTLNNLLNDATAAAIPAELLAADVSFQTPDKNYKPTTPDTAVNLFLYEVKENRERKIWGQARTYLKINFRVGMCLTARISASKSTDFGRKVACWFRNIMPLHSFNAWLSDFEIGSTLFDEETQN